MWVNGKKVLAKNEYRAVIPDQESAEITLKKGENTILVKVCQGSGGWQFYGRLADEWGFPLAQDITNNFGR